VFEPELGRGRTGATAASGCSSPSPTPTRPQKRRHFVLGYTAALKFKSCFRRISAQEGRRTILRAFLNSLNSVVGVVRPGRRRSRKNAFVVSVQVSMPVMSILLRSESPKERKIPGRDPQRVGNDADHRGPGGAGGGARSPTTRGRKNRRFRT